MRKYLTLIGQFITQIRKDAMLFIACFAPFLSGAVLHFGVPTLDKLLIEYFNINPFLKPYYYVSDILLSMLTPTLFSFVGAMVVLTEYDDQIVTYMAVTPVQNRGYMASRLLFPTVIGAMVNIIVLHIFAITDIGWKNIIIYVTFTALLGMITSMLMIAISTNKVEGMAVGKLCSIILLGVFVPIAIVGKLQYLCVALPSFWLGKYIVTGEYIHIMIGMLLSIVWFYLLNRKIARK